MKYALQLFNHNLKLACILNDAGIEEAKKINVIDPKVVRFDEWMKDRVKSKFYAQKELMYNAYEIVLNNK